MSGDSKSMVVVGSSSSMAAGGSSSKAAGGSSSTTVTPVRVLLVGKESEPFNYLKLKLEEHGYQVMAFECCFIAFGYVGVYIPRPMNFTAPQSSIPGLPPRAPASLPRDQKSGATPPFALVESGRELQTGSKRQKLEKKRNVDLVLMEYLQNGVGSADITAKTILGFLEAGSVDVPVVVMTKSEDLIAPADLQSCLDEGGAKEVLEYSLTDTQILGLKNHVTT